MNAFEDQALFRALRENATLYKALRQAFVERREQRREQSENAQGESAVLLRGKCQELTAILNEIFKEK
jgi:hypothetical protein